MRERSGVGPHGDDAGLPSRQGKDHHGSPDPGLPSEDRVDVVDEEDLQGDGADRHVSHHQGT
ncbi:hypothetical protein MICRO80W_140024 [Micrococcus luteus]|nr:hypothetical protein MICRO80W_140024 [Micrococcus luteus]